MPCAHASERPPLGRLVPCLAVADLDGALDFYGKLGFVRTGGDPSDGWAAIRSGATEIHLFGRHIEVDLLNFRGGRVDEIRASLVDRGLPTKTIVPERSFVCADPDGREAFFDTTPGETAAYFSGVSVPRAAGPGPDLGDPAFCLGAADLHRTAAHYERLGLVGAGGSAEGGVRILGRADDPPAPGRRVASTRLILASGLAGGDGPGFVGGDLRAISAAIAARGIDPGEGVRVADDGGDRLRLADPDGRAVRFFSSPPAGPIR